MHKAGVSKQLLYGELSTGRQKQSRHCKCYRVFVRVNVKLASIPPKQVESCVQDRVSGMCWLDMHMASQNRDVKASQKSEKGGRQQQM